ncbi:hypothetical protein [Aquipuribacter nitratireducens]|uniref:Lipoprotein n=1 Tax=Aquipuribacter nitratireducens TaxID=650104 RepID=A0ABW0GI99_9MICO
MAAGAAAVALLATAACSDADADDPVSSAPETVAAPSSPVASETPSAAPTSAAPSLSPSEQAVAEAEQAYRAWVDLQNRVLQDPPEISSGDTTDDETLTAFLTEVRLYGIEEAEAELLQGVFQYNDEGWRQDGTIEVASVDAFEVEPTPEDGRPYVELDACLQPVDVRILEADGGEAEEFADVDMESAYPSGARVEYVSEDGLEGWYVKRLGGDGERSC